MGKTYRNFPKDFTKKPKECKQYFATNGRKRRRGEDYTDEYYSPVDVASYLLDTGYDDGRVIQKLRHKFKYTQDQAEETLRLAKII